MIAPPLFCDYLKSFDIDFFAGVPDSLLKNLCAHIDQTYSKSQHVITANEGNAVAMAMGHYLATGNPAVAYMQNSGLGNAVNPLVSMACKEVCGIPLLLIVGWRGEPNVKDEPQHYKQGEITPGLLELMDIPYVVLDENSDLASLCSAILTDMKSNSRPVAILVKKNTFLTTESVKSTSKASMSRESALNVIQSNLNENDLVVATTGKTSRELYEIQVKEQGQCTAFLTVGAMGHASSIATSIALAKRDRRVICLDGDGALIMHMGALAVTGGLAPDNLVHVLINNYAHESVGGQPTSIAAIDVKALALANGYKKYVRVTFESELQHFWQHEACIKGPVFLEVVVRTGSRSDLGRPDPTPAENTHTFHQFAQ